jgi:septum formation protein
VRLILASASPRRADLLAAAGFTFDVRVPDADERVLPGEAPLDYVRRVAVEKSLALASEDAGDLILTADTTVTVDEAIFGKPVDRAEAHWMLERLAGREHFVHTAVAVRRSGVSDVALDVATTRVRFLSMDREEIAWYVASGEPDGKAGAYAIQGRAARFIDWIEGSYSNVVGLPVHLVHRLLTEAGYRG